MNFARMKKYLLKSLMMRKAILTPLLPGRRGFPLLRGSSFPLLIRDYIWWAVGVVREPPLKRGIFHRLALVPLERGDTGCSSHSPIKPSIELGSFRYKTFP